MSMVAPKPDRRYTKGRPRRPAATLKDSATRSSALWVRRQKHACGRDLSFDGGTSSGPRDNNRVLRTGECGGRLRDDAQLSPPRVADDLAAIGRNRGGSRELRHDAHEPPRRRRPAG